LSLSVLVPTQDPAPRIAALMTPLCAVADEVVIAVDHRVELDRLGAYEEIADHLVRFEPSGRDLAPGWLHRQCSPEWVLTLAGDEVRSSALVAALPELCADPAIRQYWLPVRWVWPDPEHWLDDPPARARPADARGRNAQRLRGGAQPGDGDVAGRHRPAARDSHVLPLARRRGRAARPRLPSHAVPGGGRARRGVHPPGGRNGAGHGRPPRARPRREHVRWFECETRVAMDVSA
jgi:hypothetical protein